MFMKQRAFPRLSLIKPRGFFRPVALLCLLLTAGLASHGALAEKSCAW